MPQPLLRHQTVGYMERGLTLAGAGLPGVTYAVIRGQQLGWTSAGILAPMAAGVAGLAASLGVSQNAKVPDA